MPQKEDKWKTLFADLGRPTLRGIRKCPKCGTVNGTRGNSCKNKTCDVVFRGNDGPRKKPSTDACQISNLPGCTEKIYSVRVRDRGPDYRSFVQITCTPTEKSENCQDLDATSQQETKCFVETCKSKKPLIECSHIRLVQKCFSLSQTLHMKHSVLSSLNIPSEHYQALSHMVNELPELAVQRVSKSSFVVKSEPVPEADTEDVDIGFVHLMFLKPSKHEPNLEKKSFCSCGKSANSQGKYGPVVISSTQMCVHYYACICAFASNEALTVEFEQFIPQTTLQFSPPLLSQLHLVACQTNDNEGKSVELDNTLSVEIMRDNLSLLESITAADDSTLVGNVQGLEGVLSDQIIVANVDDSLSFTDPAVLDSLDDTEQQVCQIFATGQNTIQLTTFSTSSGDNVEQMDISILTDHVQEVQDIDEKPDNFPPVKRKKDSRNAQIQNQNQNLYSQTQNTVIHNFNEVNLPKRTTLACVANSDSERLLWSFEHWLAGVNDRMNSTMNYQLQQNPDPLVYFIPTEFFECLKDRISTGGKKRRLPNQTLVFHRTDRAPLGTFTKHIWKITNILQIVNVFNCSIVPLKTKQYFVKTNHGDFVSWVPPIDDDEKNQRIFPVLHSTFLKCGRNHESTTKESVPFIMEWVPEIFRDSRLGELSIKLEFGKTGPIHEDDGRYTWGTKFTSTVK